MNKNFILKNGSILAFVLPISLISMQIKPNILNKNKLFKYNDYRYTVKKIRNLSNN